MSPERFRLDGRVAVITGAGSATGLGNAIAVAFAEAGCAVALGDVDAAGAERNATALTSAIGLHMDVTDEASVEQAVKEVEARLGPVDILVNNAGITSATQLWDLTVEEFDRLMAINLRGGFLCLQAVLPGMMSRRYGRLIWISSISGKQGGGVFGRSHYAASKAGIIGLCQGAARELGPYQITSNAIAPGLVLTGLVAKTGGVEAEQRLDARNRELVPLGRSAKPEDIAAAALFLASDEAAYVTGEVMDVNGGLYFD
jgi:3-oxoacyl-[acyl-carrier protein] reductase